MNDFGDLLICPLSLSLYCDPVLAGDGYTYEREAIERRIKHYATSPINDKPLSIESLRPNLKIKELVDRFEKTLKEKRYQYTLDVDVKKKKSRPLFQTFGKTIYHAEWTSDKEYRPDIILLKIDGANANKEASFYVKLSCHPNIVRTFGFVENRRNQNAIFLLQEYAQEGSLYEILSERDSPMHEKILVTMFLQICQGMCYLASQHVVHGDLACRNVLVFRLDEEDPSRIVVKVTDFGLSCHSRLYCRAPTAARTVLDAISTRYAAPEILAADVTPDDYTEQSDVFSFGVLMWEAFACGAIPWNTIANDEQVAVRIKNGEMLPRPEGCSDVCWFIMKRAWAKLPKDRPDFKALKMEFKNEFNLSFASSRRSRPLLPERVRKMVAMNQDKRLPDPEEEQNPRNTSTTISVLHPLTSSRLGIRRLYETLNDQRNKTKIGLTFSQDSVEKKPSSMHKNKEDSLSSWYSTLDLPKDPQDIYLLSRRPTAPHATKNTDPHSPRARRLSEVDHLARPMNSIFNADNQSIHSPRQSSFSRLSEKKSPFSPDEVPEKEMPSNRKKRTQKLQPRCFQDILPSPLDRPFLGKNQGIAGDWKSSCMDATLFAMFAYNDAFDEILKMKVTDQSIPLQTLLRDHIVSGLRGNEGFVERDVMDHFDLELRQWMANRTSTLLVQDAIDVLQLFQRIFQYAPLKTILTDQTVKVEPTRVVRNIFWPIDDTDGLYVPSTSTSELLRKHLFSATAKFITIPPFLVLLAPKHTHDGRASRYIIPDQQISFDESLLQLVCHNCYSTSSQYRASDVYYTCYKCNDADSSFKNDLLTPYLCGKCLGSFHNQLNEKSLGEHKPKLINVGEDKMNLIAVICVENSRHTAFVKCHQKNSADQWLFFEYTCDAEDNDKIIPHVSLVNDFDQWVNAAKNDSKFLQEIDQCLKRTNFDATNSNNNIKQKMSLFYSGILYFYGRSVN